MVYPNQCYNKVCYKGTALYFYKRLCFIFQRTLGLRFLFPVYAIPEVEITPNKHTSGGTIEKGNQMVAFSRFTYNMQIWKFQNSQ